MKYLLLAIVAYVIYRVWKGHRSKMPDTPPPAERAPEKMLVCAYCGVHLPASDALLASGKAYCNEHHLQAGGGRMDS